MRFCSLRHLLWSNSREFFERRISEALPNFNDEEELFKVYLIFSTYMLSPSGHFTPRQIISFINDLTSLYAIHQGNYPLSTVAVYTCHRERITENPLLLTDPKFLDAKLKRLATDPEIEQNLAALLFNVERQFALEILLDGRIASAATQEEAAELSELAKSRGFDLRVDAVIRAHAMEWIGAGNFGTAITNFSNLFRAYEGSAKKQSIESLIHFFKAVPEMGSEEKDYLPFFGLFDMCAPESAGVIAKLMISKAIETGMKGSKGKLDHYTGLLVVILIDKLQARISGVLPLHEFRKMLKGVKLPPDADFMLGVAAQIDESAYKLSDFGKVGFTLDKGDSDDSTLEDYARENYHISEATFRVLMDAKVVPPQKWIETANSIVDLIKDSDNVSLEALNGSLGALSAIWIRLDAEKRSAVGLDELSRSASFFVALQRVYQDQPGETGLGNAVFLIKQPLLGQALPTTEEEMRGGVTSEMQGAKQWVEDVFNGNTRLEQSQVNLVVENARKLKNLGSWLSAGRTGGDELIERVAQTSLEHSTLPHFSLTTFLSNFFYSKGLMGDGFIEVLKKYDAYISDDSLNALKLNDIPVGVLSDTQGINGGGWDKLHRWVEENLSQTEGSLWAEKLEKAEHDVCLLAEKANTSGVVIDSAAFRDAYLNCLLKVLSGEIAGFSNEIDFDEVFAAIPESFHNDIFRQYREKMPEVAHGGLSLGALIFPQVLVGVISTGDKISGDEKDNVIRHLLCPALETGNVDVLNIFLSLGRRKVNDFVKKSQESTQEKLTGAMGCIREGMRGQRIPSEGKRFGERQKRDKISLGIWFHKFIRKRRGRSGRLSS